MPAIAPSPHAGVVVVWDMPFAAKSRWSIGDLSTILDGESSRKVAREASEAYRRFRGLAEEIAAITPPQTCLLNPLSRPEELRMFAASQGVDLDALIVGASRHFASSAIIRRTDPLSVEELESLFEDDERALDR